MLNLNINFILTSEASQNLYSTVFVSVKIFHSFCLVPGPVLLHVGLPEAQIQHVHMNIVDPIDNPYGQYGLAMVFVPLGCSYPYIGWFTSITTHSDIPNQ